ncbi:MAG: hypothetical protein JSS52_00715 [Proteobacteria bacterium]|nr:hypothetical protein [Pseudomonadota bacterium]
MIRNSKQDWSVGEVVKVGFLSLKVIAKIPTPGDYMPDAYALANKDGTRFYRFTPHHGLTSVDSLEEAL